MTRESPIARSWRCKDEYEAVIQKVYCLKRAAEAVGSWEGFVVIVR